MPRRGSRRSSRRSTRRSGSSGSPYFFRRIWSPFGTGVNLAGKTVNTGLGFVDNTARGALGLVRKTSKGAFGGIGKIGHGIASSANDAIGGLVSNGSRRRSTRRRRNH